MHARNEAEGKKHCVPFWFWLQQVASRQPRTDVPMFGFLLAIPDPTCPPSPFPELKITRSVLVSLEPVLLHVDHGNFILLPFFLCRGENILKSRLIFVWSCALECKAALRSLRALALPQLAGAMQRQL